MQVAIVSILTFHALELLSFIHLHYISFVFSFFILFPAILFEPSSNYMVYAKEPCEEPMLLLTSYTSHFFLHTGYCRLWLHFSLVNYVAIFLFKCKGLSC